MNKGAVSVYSGGLDSTVATAKYHLSGWDVTALTFSYSELKGIYEVEAAEKLAKKIGFPHKILPFNWVRLASLGDAEWVRSRNLVFISIATSIAEHLGASRVVVGFNRDEQTYPDSTNSFYEAAQELVKISSQGNVELVAPFLDMSKLEIIDYGLGLGVPIQDTFSCGEAHEPSHCGECDSCITRKKAFKEYKKK